MNAWFSLLFYAARRKLECGICLGKETPFCLECHDMAQCEPLKNTKEFLLPI